MNTEKLISLLEEEIIKLNLKLSEPNEELQFIDKVVTENTFSSIKGLLNIDYLDAMVAYLCINSKKLSYKEIKERLLLNEKFIDISNTVIISFIYMYLEYEKAGKTAGFNEEAFKMNELIDYKALKELYDNNDSELFNVIALINTLKDLKEDYSKNYKLLEEEASEFGVRVTSNQKNSFLEKEIKSEYKVPAIIKEFSKIPTYYQEIKSKDKSRRKELRKRLSKYHEVKVMLINSKNIDINKILPLIENEEIKKEFLYQFNVSQKCKFDELYDEYSRLSLDNKLEIQALFNDYKIEFNNLPILTKNKVLSMNKEELKMLLEKIEQLNIQDYELINFILVNSSYQILDSINTLIKNGILTLEFVLNNKSLLSANDQSNNNYSKLMEIFELLKNESINPRIFITDLNIYLSDVATIKNNISILRQYNLLSSIKTAQVFDMLKGNNLEKKIDMLLELGYEKLLEENLELLNKDVNQIKKLYILKDMNLLPTDIESLVKVLADDKFLSFDDDIDSYIFNVVDYRVDKNLISKVEESSEIKLDTSENMTRVVEFGNVLISRNKIKRNMQILENTILTEEEKQVNSILIGSILTEEEYDSILTYLNGKEKQISL